MIVKHLWRIIPIAIVAMLSVGTQKVNIGESGFISLENTHDKTMTQNNQSNNSNSNNNENSSTTDNTENIISNNKFYLITPQEQTEAILGKSQGTRFDTEYKQDIKNEKNQVVSYFSPNITYEYDYFKNEDTIPYMMCTPSTVQEDEGLPLIIWLHGVGQIGEDIDSFEDSGLMEITKEWSLQNVNAYIAAPHLTGEYDCRLWCKDKAVEYITKMLEEIKQNYNIDTNKIMLIGHSLGGQGCTYVASKLPNTFSCVTVLSGYSCDMELPVNIPMKGFVGAPHLWEDELSYNYMMDGFKREYPDAEVEVILCSHSDLPWEVLTQDDNEDGISDIMEWMLQQTKNA